jgi:hypothetical protein
MPRAARSEPQRGRRAAARARLVWLAALAALASFSARASASTSAAIITSDRAFALPSSIVTTATLSSSA